MTGFLTYLEGSLERPVEASVVGVPVTIVSVDCPAGALRGLVARCRRDGAEYEVSLLDVALPRGSDLARILAAYRYWAGMEPWPPGATRPRGAGGEAAARR